MKKFIAGVLVGAMIASGLVFAAVAYTAVPANFKVLVNGKEFTSDPPAVVIEDRTFLPLRAIGDALGVKVEWNEELRQVEIGEGYEVSVPSEETVTNNKIFVAKIPEGRTSVVVIITAKYSDGTNRVIYSGSVARQGEATQIPVQITGEKGERITLESTYDGATGDMYFVTLE